MNTKQRGLAWRVGIASMAITLSTTTVTLATADVAHAAPGCQNGGAYILYAGGAGSTIGTSEADKFQTSVQNALNAAGITTHAWAELGNLDNSVGTGDHPDDQANEYPAKPALGIFDGSYDNSVYIGVKELIAHLNYRYALGPVGMGCTSETAILGGYSEGADLLGWAIALTDGTPLFGSPVPALTPEARRHIGFVAQYGDPHFNVACGQNRPWVRADAGCDSTSRLQPPRTSYVPSDFLSRTGSWCANGDGICAVNFWTFGLGNHTEIYDGKWMEDSAPEIAKAARLKLCSLILACSGSGTSAPPPPPPASNPFGYLEDANTTNAGDKAYVRGWALDPNTTGPITVQMYVDGNYAATTTANGLRSDIGAAYPSYGNNHGYYMEVPASIGTHQVCVLAINTGAGSGNTQLPYCKTVQRAAPRLSTNDYDGDFHSDVMFIHKLSDNGFNMHILNQASGFGGIGFVRTFPGTSAWNWNQIKTTTGDVNMDGVSDLLLLHKTGDGGANFYVFYGGSSQFAGATPVKQFTNAAGWNFDQMKMVAGDYDGDRHTDVMFLHKLVDGGANMYIYNQATSFAGPGLVRAFPGSAAWNWDLMQVTSSDVNNDGVSDLQMLHGTGDGGANYYVFYGASGQFADTAPAKQFPGSGGWNWASMKMLTGDFDGDYHADLMFLHKTGDNGGNLYIYNQAGGFNGPGLVRQFPGSSGWNWYLMKLGTGDVNYDGISDLLMFHRTGDGGGNYYTIMGGSGQFIPGSPARQLAGTAGWSWDSMIMPTG